MRPKRKSSQRRLLCRYLREVRCWRSSDVLARWALSGNGAPFLLYINFTLLKAAPIAAAYISTVKCRYKKSFGIEMNDLSSKAAPS